MSDEPSPPLPPGIRPQLIAAEAAGLELAQLARACAISEHTLTSDAALDLPAATRLWVAVAERAHDPAVALHAAEAVPPGAFDLLDYIVVNTPTLKDGLDAVVRYFGTIRTHIELKVEHGPHESSLRLRWPTAFPSPLRRFSCEFTLACVVLRLRVACERTWNPRVLRVAHGDPSYPEEYQRIFGCPVQFGAGGDELVIDARTRMLSHPRADERLRAVLERGAAQLGPWLSPPTETSTRVRTALLQLLSHGSPRLEAVAKELGMSARTLHRRLADEDTSFQALLDALRSEMAAHLLRQPDVSLAEIADALGFAELSAFSRAFRRWYQMAPAKWRRAQSTRPPHHD